MRFNGVNKVGIKIINHKHRSALNSTYCYPGTTCSEDRDHVRTLLVCVSGKSKLGFFQVYVPSNSLCRHSNNLCEIETITVIFTSILHDYDLSQTDIRIYQ